MSLPDGINIVDIYIGANYADKYTSEYAYDVCRVVSLELKNDGNLTASAIVENLTDKSEEKTIIIAQYSETGRLLGISTKEFSVDSKTDERQTLTFSTEKNPSAKRCNAFIWDSVDKITPLFKNAELKL